MALLSFSLPSVGVVWDDDAAVSFGRRLAASRTINFQGLYVHEGQSYNAKGTEELQAINTEATERCLDLANRSASMG